MYSNKRAKMENMMGKLKQLMIEEQDDLDAMMEEAHYWMLVDNVAQWLVEHKSTYILEDIQKKALSFYESAFRDQNKGR
jgi:hypothetical protein